MNKDGKAYVIVQLAIHDEATYLRYAEGADHLSLISQFGGKPLAVADEASEVEGSWPFDRTIVMEFPSSAQARGWYDSAEYQRLAPVRQAAAISNIVILAGSP